MKVKSIFALLLFVALANAGTYVDKLRINFKSRSNVLPFQSVLFRHLMKIQKV